MSPSARRALAAVYTDRDDDAAWLVAETPAEAAAAVEHALSNDALFVELTLANPNDAWNGRSVYIVAKYVRAICPPIADNDDD